MILNLNIGLLGHVDSGKTSLAKILSSLTGTAAFDKHPQSKERGITIDLGFSALQIDPPDNLKKSNENLENIQFTFVDCPGHASLIRTIIGGAQIIDFMILVIDINKGIQTQTAECIVIGELTCKKMIVVLNKLDLIEKDKQDEIVKKQTKKINNILSKTIFKDSPIIPISVTSEINIAKVIDELKNMVFIPERRLDLPFLFAVDHCFQIKGQGTIFTGTVLQGKACLNDNLEIAQLNICGKLKSIQMFRKSKTETIQGDRVGLCIPKIEVNNFERGLLSIPGYIKSVKAGIFKLNQIKYYQSKIASNMKFHITIGHETVLGTITMFTSFNETFNLENEYLYLNEINDEIKETIFCLLEFDRSIYISPESFLIGSKFDTDVKSPKCRLSFYGKFITIIDEKNFNSNFLEKLLIYKEKHKEGKILRILNNKEMIATNLFKKETNRLIYIGMKVILTTGDIGVIDSTFGQTSKIKIKFPNEISNENISQINKNLVKVNLNFKKFIYSKKIKGISYEKKSKS